jgi:hypothetical protein
MATPSTLRNLGNPYCTCNKPRFSAPLNLCPTLDFIGDFASFSVLSTRLLRVGVDPATGVVA